MKDWVKVPVMNPRESPSRTREETHYVWIRSDQVNRIAYENDSEGLPRTRVYYKNANGSEAWVRPHHGVTTPEEIISSMDGEASLDPELCSLLSQTQMCVETMTKDLIRAEQQRHAADQAKHSVEYSLSSAREEIDRLKSMIDPPKLPLVERVRSAMKQIGFMWLVVILASFVIWGGVQIGRALLSGLSGPLPQTAQGTKGVDGDGPNSPSCYYSDSELEAMAVDDCRGI